MLVVLLVVLVVLPILVVVGAEAINNYIIHIKIQEDMLSYNFLHNYDYYH